MIQLRSDCLIFQTGEGDQIPCSAEWVALELLGGEDSWVEPDLVRHVAAAVLHYFKLEECREYVSVGEFAQALDKVLRGFGLTVYADVDPLPAPERRANIVNSNLQELASAAGKGFELVFFPHLREELKNKMDQLPNVVLFHGLRGCVKQLSGSERWSQRCQHLNDQIVDFLRGCWQSERASQNCALVVL